MIFRSLLCFYLLLEAFHIAGISESYIIYSLLLFKISMYFTKILLNLLNIALMVILIFPILTIILIPFALYRLLISILVRFLRKDLLSIVPCRDSVFANDKISTSPSSTIVITVFIEGDMDLETFQSRIERQLLGGDLTPNPQHTHAVLMQYFENWGGFVFRKWEESFNLKNHCREWKSQTGSEIVTPDELYHLRRKILTEPYHRNRSAWETVLVRNYQESDVKPKGSIIIIKLHHGVLDGFSIIKMIWVSCSKLTNLQDIVPHAISKPLTTLQNMGVFLKLFMETPTTAMNQSPTMDPANIFDPNHPLTKPNLTGKRHPVSTTIPVKTVKVAAKQSGTSFTAVIMEGLTGGVRNYLLLKKKEVPSRIDVTIPLPWPGHDINKFQNHFTFATLEIPTGIPDHICRLRNLQDQFIGLKQSSIPPYNYLVTFLVGMLPNLVMSPVLGGSPSSILLSTIPGPNCSIDMFDHSLTQPPTFEGGYGKGKVGLGVTMLSTDDRISITINPDEGIIPTKNDAEQLLQSIVDEIQLIHDSTFV